MVGTLKPAAALATSDALVRSVIASIDRVANDICDCRSIITSAWSLGDSRPLPGVGVAVLVISDPLV